MSRSVSKDVEYWRSVASASSWEAYYIVYFTQVHSIPTHTLTIYMYSLTLFIYYDVVYASYVSPNSP